MALNLADRDAVRRVIVPRCRAACVKYALYLMNGTPTVNQKTWAQNCLSIPDQWGEQLSYYVMAVDEFIAGGSDITDAVLQGAVESAINNHVIQA
jgi:hypothetical protein